MDKNCAPNMSDSNVDKHKKRCDDTKNVSNNHEFINKNIDNTRPYLLLFHLWEKKIKIWVFIITRDKKSKQ